MTETKPIRDSAYSPGRKTWGSWPVYEAAEVGLPNFWYPVMWSRRLGKKPVAVQLLGRRIVLVRDRGTARALSDRCPHRGVPLSLGTCQFEGTITCPYHGWTYDLESGLLAAVITDGPDSPITGKVAVETYPVAEKHGLVWIFIGDRGRTPPPLEDDLPVELRSDDVTVCGKIVAGREGNWRYAAENGFDEGHAKFLHRNSLWAGLRELPVWSETEIVTSEDGEWISRRQNAVHWEAEFEGLGTWTSHRWWKRRRTPAKPGDRRRLDPVIAAMELPGMVSVRVPYILRVAYGHFIHYEWAIGEDPDHHRYVQLLVSFKRSFWSKLWFRLRYYTYIRWVFHTQFTGQDAWMVDVTDIPPERLYRPDASVIAYRKLVEARHRENGE